MLHETFVALDGRRVNVARGPDSGPPLVLFHGVTRRWQCFLPLVPALATRWEVLAWDARGHGRSDRTADGYGVVDYVRDAVDFLRDHVAEPAIVYGHSLGAMVAAAVAAELPDRVRAVVMEDPPFDTMGRSIAQSRLLSFFTGARKLAGSDRPLSELAAAVADLQFVDPATQQSVRLGGLRDAAAVRFMAACLKQLDPAVLDPVIAGRWLDGYDRDAILGRIQCPALLLQADVNAGGMLPDEDADHVAARIPDCTRVRLDGAGHLLHWERTQEVGNLLVGFFTSVE